MNCTKRLKCCWAGHPVRIQDGKCVECNYPVEHKYHRLIDDADTHCWRYVPDPKTPGQGWACTRPNGHAGDCSWTTTE